MRLLSGCLTFTHTLKRTTGQTRTTPTPPPDRNVWNALSFLGIPVEVKDFVNRFNSRILQPIITLNRVNNRNRATD